MRSRIRTSQARNESVLARFRSFRPEDLPKLERMSTALYREDPEGKPITVGKVRRTVSELNSHPEKGRIVVFTADRDVVGYSILVYCWSNEHGGNIVHVDELFVRKGWRRRGIATAFLEHISRKQSAKALQLEVTPSNRRALSFYRRLGFKNPENAPLVKELRKRQALGPPD